MEGNFPPKRENSAKSIINRSQDRGRNDKELVVPRTRTRKKQDHIVEEDNSPPDWANQRRQTSWTTKEMSIEKRVFGMVLHVIL